MIADLNLFNSLKKLRIWLLCENFQEIVGTLDMEWPRYMAPYKILLGTDDKHVL